MLTESHPPTAQFLAEELRKRTQRNPRYSLRAFAGALGVSPGELSEVMSGKRKLTFKNAIKISSALGHSPEESDLFFSMIKQEIAIRAGVTLPRDTAGSDLERKQLSQDFFHLVSDWFCFAIINLAETRGFRFETAFIAKRLGISATDAKLAIDRLFRVGLIERANGKIRVTPDFVLAPEGVPSAAVRKFHGQILEKAKTALETQAVEERDIAGISFAVDPAQIPALKKEIHDFLDRLATRLDRADPKKKTEVYHLETALFRLSETERKPL